MRMSRLDVAAITGSETDAAPPRNGPEETGQTQLMNEVAMQSLVFDILPRPRSAELRLSIFSAGLVVGEESSDPGRYWSRGGGWRKSLCREVKYEVSLRGVSYGPYTAFIHVDPSVVLNAAPSLK